MGQQRSLHYQTGFGNFFATEAIPGTLPEGQNSPQVCAHGLYAEQLSGSPFTAPRKDNLRSWLYRKQPSVAHTQFEESSDHSGVLHANDSNSAVTPNQLRWLPLPEAGAADFAHSMFTVCGCGSPLHKTGYAIHMYRAATSMDYSFCNADGDYLIVVQQGALDIQTEFGWLHVEPQEVCVIQRGMHFAVHLAEQALARGYILEIFESHFVLPELGPIGANGLANPRDFQVPVAHFEGSSGATRVVQKLGGRLFSATRSHTPFDVVAWHGNYVPYKYDLRKFCPMNTVRFDHADPSIFTVLTCPSSVPGTAVADFVVFPPRWSVAENTFRPPYFHRNIMSEFMGLICGAYEAKQTFQPGGASLHVCMSPHGPDMASFAAASSADTAVPQRLPSSTMAFMFEVSQTPQVMHSALNCSWREIDYQRCWAGFQQANVSKRKAGSHDNGHATDSRVQKRAVQAEVISSG